MDRLSVAEITLKNALRYIVVFAGLAMVAAGCSDARMAANNAASSSAASNNGQVQPSSYQVGYGLSSEGPTTDLYHELKGSLQRPERPQATAAVPPVTSAGPQLASAAPQGASAGPQVAESSSPAVQQPAAPPREEPTATVYGLSSDGPTTDLYTALFGSRNP